MVDMYVFVFQKPNASCHAFFCFSIRLILRVWGCVLGLVCLAKPAAPSDNTEEAPGILKEQGVKFRQLEPRNDELMTECTEECVER